MTKDKVYGVLSYLGILSLIPILNKENEFQHFHAEQGLTLYLISSALLSIAGVIPFIGGIVYTILGIGCCVYSVLGIINVCRNQMCELPFIGVIKLLK